MTEAECLAAISEGADARDLLLTAMPSAARRFQCIDRAIVKLLADVHEHFPDAEYYTASGGFNLMLGKSHDQTVNPLKMRGQQQLVALSGRAAIGDGDF